MEKPSALSTSYDRIAAAYTIHIADELTGKPLDRALLRAFAEGVGELGPICDVGCGPGHVAALLATLTSKMGTTVEGIDFSAGMIEQARARYPHLTFQQGNMRALPLPDASLGGIVALYSIIHLAPAELVPTPRDWHRALRPGSLVLVAFHVGNEVGDQDEM